TVAHLRHFEKRSFERKIEAIHPVQSVIPLKFTGRSRPPVMIGNPFCTIKVFWNFHTKNRLAQVRHSVSRNSTRCKRGNSRARLCLTRLLPLLGTPSTKFYGKSRTRSTAPRTQFAAKFPCRCRRRRRMSADGDGS